MVPNTHCGSSSPPARYGSGKDPLLLQTLAAPQYFPRCFFGRAGRVRVREDVFSGECDKKTLCAQGCCAVQGRASPLEWDPSQPSARLLPSRAGCRGSLGESSMGSRAELTPTARCVQRRFVPGPALGQGCSAEPPQPCYKPEESCFPQPSASSSQHRPPRGKTEVHGDPLRHTLSPSSRAVP